MRRKRLLRVEALRRRVSPWQKDTVPLSKLFGSIYVVFQPEPRRVIEGEAKKALPLGLIPLLQEHFGGGAETHYARWQVLTRNRGDKLHRSR